MLLGIIDGNALLYLGSGGSKLTQVIQGIPKSMVGFDEEGRIVYPLGHGQHPLSYLVGFIVFSQPCISPAQAGQRKEELGRTFKMLAELIGPLKGCSGFWSCLALHTRLSGNAAPLLASKAEGSDRPLQTMRSDT